MKSKVYASNLTTTRVLNEEIQCSINEIQPHMCEMFLENFNRKLRMCQQSSLGPLSDVLFEISPYSIYIITLFYIHYGSMKNVIWKKTFVLHIIQILGTFWDTLYRNNIWCMIMYQQKKNYFGDILKSANSHTNLNFKKNNFRYMLIIRVVLFRNIEFCVNGEYLNEKLQFLTRKKQKFFFKNGRFIEKIPFSYKIRMKNENFLNYTAFRFSKLCFEKNALKEERSHVL